MDYLFTSFFFRHLRYQIVSKMAGMLLAALLVLGALPGMAQTVTVSGKVTDPQGEGIPGAAVLEKGTQNGVITDYDGNFNIQVSKDATLVISFLGYKTVEVPVGNRTRIDVSLEEDVEQLGEVVVVGYGSVQKEDVTGVVAKVEEKEFNKGIIGSPDKLLAGKVAGMQVTSGNEPGSGTAIRIRGTSINGQNPLYVVDGVPLDDGGVAGGRNPLNFMNPNDVESITVLKDASAAAIYGSRGANGVILITTKKGSGKMRVTYDGYYSLSMFVQDFPNLTPSQFRQAIKVKAPQELPNLGTANTDWIKEVTQLAQGMQHNISVSGGKKSSNYFASFNYLGTQGVLRTSANQNISLSLKYNQKLLNDALTLTINTKNGFTKDRFAPNVIWSAMRFDPTRPVYDPNGPGGYYQWTNGLAVGNPVATLDLNNNRGNTFRTLSNFMLEYKLPFLEGLSFKANIGYDRNYGEYHGVTSEFEKANFQNNRGKYVRDETNLRWSLVQEYYANYNRELADINSKLNLTLGYSWQNFRSEFTQLAGFGATEIDGKLVPTDTTDSRPYNVENRLISFFGRLNFDVAGKYLFTATLRRDGSTRFGPANRWGWFPSAAFGWRIIDESFAESWQNVFSDLKLRIGYGITGNQAIPDYLYSTYYKYSQPDAAYQFGNEYVLTLRPKGVDPNIKWEETNSFNVGIDAGVLDGRIQFALEYYIKNVKDLLFMIAIPAGTNLSDRVLTNIGELENKGFEFTLNTIPVHNENFRWDLAFNLATNKNRVIKLDNQNDPDFGGYPTGGISGDVGQTIQVLKEGEEAFAFYTYKQKYENGKPVTDVNGDGIQSLIEMYEDINGDGIINEKDLVVGPSPAPKVLIGLTSNMTYKNFDLSFTLRSNLGNYTYNNTASSAGYFALLTDQVTNNIHVSAFDTNFKNRQLHSDYYVENASFLKMDNITLGYSFKNISFGNLRAYITAQNVFTLTGYSGLEPEQFNGIDNNPYPRSLSLLGGLSFQFK